jgi:hypothetical protein
MSSHYFEKHSIRTLAMRFKGLASRNTIVRWIRENKLRPDMTDKTPAPYLFKRSVLDDAEKLLQEAHERRIKRLTKGETEFRRIRDKVRADCLSVHAFNDRAVFSGKPHLIKHEPDPALHDSDAVGANTFNAVTTAQRYRISSGLGLWPKGQKTK